MKKLLVPTDFSPAAREAEHMALELAKAAGAELHYVHIVHTPIEWVGLPLEKENLYPETKARIGQARDALNKLTAQAEALGLTARAHMVYNRGREEIVALIHRCEIDMVIMGSHGAEGIKEMIGSNAQMLVRYSPVPVLVVKGQARPIKRIVFASNFVSLPLDSARVVNTLADVTGAKVNLLFVNTPYDFRETAETKRDMQEFIQASGLKGAEMHIYNALNAERGLMAFAREQDADLVVLASLARTGLLRLITASLRESVVNHIDLPVLSISA
jgi:nucleotide-binding universal stress UspA family protein